MNTEVLTFLILIIAVAASLIVANLVQIIYAYNSIEKLQRRIAYLKLRTEFRTKKQEIYSGQTDKKKDPPKDHCT